MTDFTKKGTKLPVIPAGTKYKFLRDGTFKEPSESNQSGVYTTYNNFISFGKFENKKQTYVICDSENALAPNIRYLIKLSTIERLAKEQGMCEEKIEIKWMNWEPFRFLESQPDLIVRMSCGHEILMKPNECLTTIDCGQCKTNQMNPTIKLQENGTVAVKHERTQILLEKSTVDEICRLVKDDGEKVKLENNTWVFVERKNETNNGKPALVFFQRHGVETYGFAHDGSFIIDYGSRDTFKEHKITPATPETVEQYLKAEADKELGKIITD